MNKKDLKEFFNQFGEVVSVNFAFKIGKFVIRLKDIIKQKERLKKIANKKKWSEEKKIRHGEKHIKIIKKKSK